MSICLQLDIQQTQCPFDLPFCYITMMMMEKSRNVKNKNILNKRCQNLAWNDKSHNKLCYPIYRRGQHKAKLPFFMKQKTAYYLNLCLIIHSAHGVPNRCEMRLAIVEITLDSCKHQTMNVPFQLKNDLQSKCHNTMVNFVNTFKR